MINTTRFTLVSIILSGLILSSCGKGINNESSVTTNKQQPVISVESKKIATQIGKLSVDKKNEFIVGNESFKAYKTLTIVYKNLASKEEGQQLFSGAQGYVKLDKLSPGAYYSYSIYAEGSHSSITSGSFMTTKH